METSQNVVDVLHLQERNHELAKTLTGIRGLDEITRGGLPKGRPTLVCGGPGSGKTLLALTFLVNGAVQLRRTRRAHDVRRERRGDGQRRGVTRL